MSSMEDSKLGTFLLFFWVKGGFIAWDGNDKNSMPSYVGAFSTTSEFETLELVWFEEGIADDKLIEEEAKSIPQETKKMENTRPPKNLFLRFITPPTYN